VDHLKQRLRQLVQKTDAAQVLVFVASHQRARIIQQEYVMNARSHTARPIDNQPNISRVPLDFPTFAQDSFEGCHWLLTESERINQPSEGDRQVQEPAIRRWRSVGAADGLEEGLHWLISAAVLACLGLVIFGL
jgi:hypothetical protein